MKNPALDYECSGDEELMDRLVHHDRCALQKLYKRYGDILHGVAMRVLHDETDTEEVLQDVFVQLWQKPEKYLVRKGTPLGWLVTLAHRRAIDRVRHRLAYRRATERLETSARHRTPAREDFHSVDRQAERADLRHFLEEMIRRLPSAQRDVIEWTFFSGMSQRQIATTRHLPLGTVKTRIELGLRRLTAMVALMKNKVA
jgi:RNA polymerase sigma-70 factor (ECF subfamily)